MMANIQLVCALAILSSISCHPHLYHQRPYFDQFGYNTHPYGGIRPYADQIQTYQHPFVPTYPDFLPEDNANVYIPSEPTLNVLAEMPYAITNKFTVVSMVVMAKENMRMISSAHIMQVSRKKPLMTIKTETDDLLQCTPAVKIHLDKPIIVYSLRTNVVFPAEIDIVHEGFKIPIRVGAIIAPVRQDTYVSVDTPISINVVYAVPTRPVIVDYVNNNDVIDVPDTQAVIVESSNAYLPPRNVTVIDFPDKEAEPVLQVDESDDELVNRNPPSVLAPGGIVQSTQPITHVGPFQNSKESPVLTALREEAKKKRI